MSIVRKIAELRNVWRHLRFEAESSRQREQVVRGSYKNPKVLMGRVMATLNRQLSPSVPITQAEFQVFSQFGDDGIIQHLINHIPNIPKSFIEFGVEDYTESNTRFLLLNNKWSGLVLDGSEENVARISGDEVSWLFDLRSRAEFITAENINRIIDASGFSKSLGILSIDIDGMDYWIWEALRDIRPAIVIVEYNSLFGTERPITVPYRPDFSRLSAHPSKLYWGVSIAALYQLATSRRYAFVGCNLNGNNAYFVDQDMLGDLRPVTVEEGFRRATFSEFAKDGVPLRGVDALEVIRGLEVVNVETGKQEKL